MTFSRACPSLWSDAEIVNFCFNANGETIIGGCEGGVLVAKISDEAVVKFGLGVRKEEAENQTKAYTLLSPHVVRVPRVYHFFSNTAPGDWTRGYLIMEFIKGTMLPLEDQAHVERVASLLAHFSEIQSDLPGPLQRGGAQGQLWSEYEQPCFNSLGDMECWLNSRLRPSDTKLLGRLALRDFPLVLCHLDIAPRNLLWLENGTMCLLDWASAGFYPRFFEICMLMISDGMNGDFEPLLLDSMEKLTSEESSQLGALMRSYGNGVRFYYVSP